MSRSRLLARRRRRPEINIVPLIDISVKLIFFFLVSMQFREVSTLNVTLPTSETAGSTQETETVVIAVGREGSFEIRGRVLDKAGLATELKTLSAVARSTTILIRSDQKTPIQSVIDAMDACRSLGLNTIRFQTQ